MKYGDSLQQRSIPVWETYNVDYNDIKHLIKAHTSKDNTQPQAIAPREHEVKVLGTFEQELFAELKEQHQRIDLFVKSKSGEISRRLTHLDKQITHLELRASASPRLKVPMKRIEKFSRAEEEALKAGEEIQSLSRFVGAQTLAFQKLLKKYKKWSGSSTLGIRFRSELLDKPTSFSQRDFQPLLAQWTDVLAAVRAPFSDSWKYDPAAACNETKTSRLTPRNHDNQRGDWDAADQSTRTANSAAELHRICKNEAEVDMDTALATLPLGQGATHAVYWVHPDNIVQIHVLLLQYTRLRRSRTASTSITPPSSRSSPRGSLNGSTFGPLTRTDDDLGLIVCDDLQRFAKNRSSETIGDSEDLAGTAAEKAAASIRYSSKSDAVVVALDTEGHSNGKSKHRPFPKTSFKRKAVRQLFAGGNIDGNPTTEVKGKSKQISDWLASHREVQPLVHLQCKRTRLLGLKNTEKEGIWVTLDKDISMRGCSSELLTGDKSLLAISEDAKAGSVKFPHAVLEVRIEGDGSNDLITALDESHLTERVRGFSLETHAVAIICKPQGMPRPFWLPALQTDIRKVPDSPKLPRSPTSRKRFSQELPNTRRTSISATSTINEASGSGFSARLGESSATSAPEIVRMLPPCALKQKRRLPKGRQQPDSRVPTAINNRYWNEFDDDSEGDENEAYTILVDPNASSSFPGAGAISKLFSSLITNLKSSSEKASSWLKVFQPHQEPVPNEHQPLINGHASPNLEEDSDLSGSETATRHSASRGHYSTFHPPQTHAIRSREQLLLHSCIASFATSALFLVIAALLVMTGRHKAAMAIDAGIIVGVASTLVFGLVGLGCFLKRRGDVGWVHRSVVGLCFLGGVGGSGGVVACLGRF